jgi:hypothetical protein
MLFSVRKIAHRRCRQSFSRKYGLTSQAYAEVWESFRMLSAGWKITFQLLLQIPVTIAVSKAVSAIKANSSRWANEQGKDFSWQRGYGLFSVSHSTIPAVVRYIQNQEIHHRKMSFEAEFVGFLKKHELEFDAKYVFD